MLVNGIDISQWQGLLNLNDFELIKSQNIDFVIIRCGYTSFGKDKGKFIDKYFENNYNLAKKVGLNVGTYYYSCATSVEEAKEEAEFVLDLIKDKQFEYPIVFDTEDNHDIDDIDNYHLSQFSIGKDLLTEITKTFCDILEKNNYYVSIYASSYWLKTCLNLNELQKYDKWIAQWSNTQNNTIKHGIWQYSSTGKINGIDGNVDLDYSYVDYPKIIRESNLNGFLKSEKYKVIVNYTCNNEKLKDSEIYLYGLSEIYEIKFKNIGDYVFTNRLSLEISEKDITINLQYDKKDKKVIKLKNIFEYIVDKIIKMSKKVKKM